MHATVCYKEFPALCSEHSFRACGQGFLSSGLDLEAHLRMDSKSGSVFSLKSQIPTVTSPTAEIPPRFFFSRNDAVSIQGYCIPCHQNYDPWHVCKGYVQTKEWHTMCCGPSRLSPFPGPSCSWTPTGSTTCAITFSEDNNYIQKDMFWEGNYPQGQMANGWWIFVVDECWWMLIDVDECNEYNESWWHLVWKH